MGSEDFVEGFSDVVADHLVVGDIEVVEDGLVQSSANLVARREVQSSHISEEIEEGLDVALARSQVGCGYRELFVESLAFGSDLAKSLPNTFLRKRSIGGEIEEIVFLGLDGTEPVLQLGASEAFSAGLVANCLLDRVAHEGVKNELVTGSV